LSFRLLALRDERFVFVTISRNNSQKPVVIISNYIPFSRTPRLIHPDPAIPSASIDEGSSGFFRVALNGGTFYEIFKEMDHVLIFCLRFDFQFLEQLLFLTRCFVVNTTCMSQIGNRDDHCAVFEEAVRPHHFK
jgi:hypothetical protein